ncbi:hypothetical protein PENTCL1PPCAC_13597, partial [Pristionchus entomophagus]
AEPDRLTQFAHLEHRLFRGISFLSFFFKLRVDSIPLDSIRQIFEQFEIELVRLYVVTEQQSFNARQLIADFPRSKYTVYLQHMPPVDKLLSLPPMEEMHAIGRGTIPVEAFFQLIAAHNVLKIYRESVVINWEELKQAMKIISSDSREKTANLIVFNASMVKWLRSEGFTESTRPGQSCRRFELIANGTTQQSEEDDHDNDFKLRYKQCFIRVNRFAWSGEEK